MPRWDDVAHSSCADSLQHKGCGSGPAHKDQRQLNRGGEGVRRYQPGTSYKGEISIRAQLRDALKPELMESLHNH